MLHFLQQLPLTGKLIRWSVSTYMPSFQWVPWAVNALVAITLMIAESNPAEKETMVKLMVNLINNRN